MLNETMSALWPMGDLEGMTHIREWFTLVPFFLKWLRPPRRTKSSLLEMRVLPKLRNTFSCPKKGNMRLLLRGVEFKRQGLLSALRLGGKVLLLVRQMENNE